MASFLDGGSGQATSYTVARLKSIASHVIDLKKTCEFDMYGAVVDHDAVSHANITFSTAATELLQETVCFAIIENAFLQIDGTGRINHTLEAQFHSNYVMVPFAGDQFLVSLAGEKDAA
jgi:GMP synthase PP-ATPase subunit